MSASRSDRTVVRARASATSATRAAAAQAGARIIDVHGGDPSGDSKFTKSAAIAKAVIAALH
jgi:hypothetical protein